jgi:hypothetical protein
MWYTSTVLNKNQFGIKMIKFRVTTGSEIRALEVVKETAKQIVYKSSNFGKTHEYREAIKSEYQSWFDTFEEARQFLIEQAEDEMKLLMRKIEIRQEIIMELKDSKQQNIE